ncbi:hypothetical protein EVAR_34789_1 [Eumeta japonica]|uniref:Uncharacterized protein n=1 Tax=Eumeta variegata TaxID=151549 RepID=A0A4C1WA76_EUMVA|nr:hypothetical protein EVAR_34789_1 [Eumeta japonica]
MSHTNFEAPSSNLVSMALHQVTRRKTRDRLATVPIRKANTATAISTSWANRRTRITIPTSTRKDVRSLPLGGVRKRQIK